MAENKNKYRAFLSSSPLDNQAQRPDLPAAARCWGDWLHAALTEFSIPPEFIGQANGRGETMPARLAPLFRDESELPATLGLTPEIRAALEQSVCLVVICSPHSARSQQVNEVVRYFKQLGRGQNIFPFVVAGEPEVCARPRSDASPAEECFVPALLHPVQADGTVDTSRRAGKCMYVDARHGGEKREILVHDHRQAGADLEAAKIQLIALVLGVGFPGLWSREQKRHLWELAAAQQQAREAQHKIEETWRQLQDAEQQVREARHQALELQNLPRDVHGQIQEAQTQAAEAQQRARAAESQLEEFQNQVRDTQNRLAETRQQADAAEGRVREAQEQARLAQEQLQLAGNQIHKFQSQASATQTQLEAAREQVRQAQAEVVASQDQLRAAHDQIRELQNQHGPPSEQTAVGAPPVSDIQNRDPQARRLTRVFAVLAALALMTAGAVAVQNWRQRQAARQALDRATAEAAGNFELAIADEPGAQLLIQIGGAKQVENRRRSLDELAVWLPREEISAAIKAASVIADDQERSHFQKWLLIRLGWANPLSAIASAGAVGGKIVNDAGADDSNLYFQLAVLDNWMQTDWPGAFQWVCQLPDAVARERALDKLLGWVRSQPDSAVNHQRLVHCIAELAQTDLPAALDLAGTLPANAGRGLIERLWLQAHPLAVAQWIARLNSPPETKPPHQASSPPAKFFPDANIADPAWLAAPTGISFPATNGPSQLRAMTDRKP